MSKTQRQNDLELAQDIVKGSLEAWHHFIDQYAGLIHAVIRKHVRDDDAVRTVFVDVLEQLYSEGLAGYQGRASLATWLALVARGKSLDHVRHRVGRQELPSALSELSSDEQRIFKLYYRHGLTIEEVLNQLRSEGRPSTVEAIADTLGMIESKLGRVLLRRLDYEREARSTWADSGRALEFVDRDRDEREVASRIEQPDLVLMRKEDQAFLSRVRSLMEDLPEEERRVLALRFDQELTAREVARELGLAGQRQVYSISDRALRRLRRWLGMA